MRKQKLYYLPGLISLIGLPVLLFFLGPEDPVIHNSLKLNLTSNEKDTTGLLRFTNESVYKAIKGKKRTNIYLDDDFPYDDMRKTYFQTRKLHFITQEIERLRFGNDTNRVVKIVFGENCSYSDFIWVLNHAWLYDIKRYALIENELYLLPNPIVIPYNGTIDELYVDPFTPAKEPTWWENFTREMKYKWWGTQAQFSYLFNQQKQNKYLAAGFLLLILVPGMLTIGKFIKNTRVYTSRPEYLVQD